MQEAETGDPRILPDDAGDFTPCTGQCTLATLVRCPPVCPWFIDDGGTPIGWHWAWCIMKPAHTTNYTHSIHHKQINSLSCFVYSHIIVMFFSSSYHVMAGNWLTGQSLNCESGDESGSKGAKKREKRLSRGWMFKNYQWFMYFILVSIYSGFYGVLYWEF